MTEPLPDQVLPRTPGVPLGRHEGRVAFADLVRQTIAVADAQGWREWWWCDADFADWPLGERAVIESLERWVGQGRKLHLLARDFRALRQAHARFVPWRVRWDHCIEAKACPSAPVDDFPSGMWMPTACWTRIDPVRSVAVATDEPQRRVGFQQCLQGWWAKATPAFPASTLGL